MVIKVENLKGLNDLQLTRAPIRVSAFSRCGQFVIFRSGISTIALVNIKEYESLRFFNQMRLSLVAAIKKEMFGNFKDARDTILQCAEKNGKYFAKTRVQQVIVTSCGGWTRGKGYPTIGRDTNLNYGTV
uniref:Uncharacterized protein n=1 Tax=Tanacetum cinerariifolium TaxID=118510 RepID=A0A6L2MY94_TANCI|nr:hypothetical protein [Tanacetum cinerariifolium]